MQRFSGQLNLYRLFLGLFEGEIGGEGSAGDGCFYLVLSEETAEFGL